MTSNTSDASVMNYFNTVPGQGPMQLHVNHEHYLGAPVPGHLVPPASDTPFMATASLGTVPSPIPAGAVQSLTSLLGSHGIPGAPPAPASASAAPGPLSPLDAALSALSSAGVGAGAGTGLSRPRSDFDFDSEEGAVPVAGAGAGAGAGARGWVTPSTPPVPAVPSKKSHKKQSRPPVPPLPPSPAPGVGSGSRGDRVHHDPSVHEMEGVAAAEATAAAAVRFAAALRVLSRYGPRMSAVVAQVCVYPRPCAPMSLHMHASTVICGHFCYPPAASPGRFLPAPLPSSHRSQTWWSTTVCTEAELTSSPRGVRVDPPRCACCALLLSCMFLVKRCTLCTSRDERVS